MSIPILVNASESIDLLRAGQKPAPDVQRIDSPANLEEGHLRVLGARLKDMQRSLGRSKGNLTPFDGEAAPVLHELLRLDRRSATLPGFWAYLSVVSFPDIVQWRFGGPEKQAPENRYLGHGWKNTFKRLWYRAELAYDPTLDDPYQYARLGGEDFWVGLIERRFCECRNLTRQLLRFWFDSESDSARTMTDHRRFFIAVRLLRPFRMYERLHAKEAFELFEHAVRLADQNWIHAYT